MISRYWLAVAPLLAACPSVVSAQQPAVSVAAMRQHIEVLASDAYEGRKPGTPGETKTLLYIASQFQALGLEPVGGEGQWYQPVGLVDRKPFAQRILWSVDGAPIAFDQGSFIAIGKEGVESLADAPVYFVGHGAVIPDRGVNQLEGADLKGAVALVLYDPPKVDDFPSYAERVKAVIAAGAAAVIGIASDEAWAPVTGSFTRGQNRLQIEPTARIQGAMPLAGLADMLTRSGSNLDALVNGATGPAFKPVLLRPRATIDVSTLVHAYESHNVIGRLRGSGKTGESVLYLGHWDHLGICRPNDPLDKICNGAVDNASGIAMMIEIARHIAKGPKPVRDILFMGTTGEEMGLLGAEYFGRKPVVPIKSLVAAINIDTVAIAGKGEPVAIVGRGTTKLDALVDATARELGREVDSDLEANAFVQRQDGWALTRAGVPTVMVGGSFANMTTLGAFLSGPYHKPNDDLAREIVLDGAAEDTDLLIALGRKLADPAQYQPAQR